MIRPEDEKKINQIVLNLKRSKEIACILLVLFNDELLRQDVEAEIKRRLEPDFNFRELRMTEDMYKNLPVIITREMNPQPNDIFLIYDLKKALPEVLEYLNYRREDFVEHKISVIFWLDELTLIGIMRKALDFFAFRAAPVIEFMVDRSKEMVIPGRTTPSDVFIYDSLEELDAKIALREEILNDYLEKRPNDRFAIASLHNELGDIYYNKSQYDRAIAYYMNCLDIYKEIKFTKGVGNTLASMGRAYRHKGDTVEASNFFQKALNMFRQIGDLQGESKSLNYIGLVHRDEGNIDTALECFLQALDIADRIGYNQMKAECLDDIGVLYRIKGKYDKAMEYIMQALEVARSIKYIRGEVNYLNDISNVYYDKNDIENSIDFASQALTLSQQIRYDREEVSALSNLGSLYYTIGNLDKALDFYLRALDISSRIGYTRGKAIALNGIGEIYHAKGNFKIALNYTKESLGILISSAIMLFADKSYKNLQNIVSQMKTRGIEISQEDAKEIEELTKQYEKMKKE